jgi:hypothetical protein
VFTFDNRTPASGRRIPTTPQPATTTNSARPRRKHSQIARSRQGSAVEVRATSRGDDWEWGFVNGKLPALRRVLGEDWDFLAAALAKTIDTTTQ